jgi:hypothetical protein
MAVFVAASAFATASGATSLRAVSNRTHTINADAQYQRRKRHADYDAFWIERGGAPDDWGFKIPLEPTPRTNRISRNERRAQVTECVYQLFGAPTINRAANLRGSLANSTIDRGATQKSGLNSICVA